MKYFQLRLLFAIFCCLVFGMFLLPSSFAASPNEIDKLREEISVIEGRIREIESGRENVLQQLQEYDKKIELRHRLIRELQKLSRQGSEKVKSVEKRIAELDRQIAVLNGSLVEKESDLDLLRQKVGKRIAYLYRRLSGSRIAVLFGARSPNDLFQRQQYLKAIERFDRANIKRLMETRDAVQHDREALEKVQLELSTEKKNRITELEKVQGLLRQRKSEQTRLTGEKAVKTKILGRITSDTELLTALLDERRRSLQEIENAIKSLDRQPDRSLPDFSPETPFSALQGRLPWPLRNRTIAIPFGSIRHPKLKTVTVNPGVDLKASPGDPVYSVAHGQVTRISYLRGFGNTIILAHGKGYFTVYARLGTIHVGEGEIVAIGGKLGEVGETGAEANFHFEIWAQRKTQNPLKWLKKG